MTDAENSEGAGSKVIWCQSALLADGWARNVRLTLAGGRIARIDTDVPAGHAIRLGPALPGLANVHSHAFQRAMAGLAEARGDSGDNFWTWREVMYRFLERLGPDEVQTIAAMGQVEMLEGGFTRVGEFHYLHHDPSGGFYDDPAEMAVRIAAAADETGIGLTLLPVFYAHANFGGAPPTDGQKRFIHDVDGFARLVERCREIVSGMPQAVVGIAPHSLRAVTAEELDAILPLAGDGPVHMHVAEQTKEVDDCLAATGQRPVRWLMNHTPVDRRWCLIHATHINAVETERLARSGAVAGLCPVTEANLGDGVFPTHDYLAAGGAFGLGTDSNILIEAAEEVRALEYAQRLTRRARNVLAGGPRRSTGGDLWRGACAGGAQALGAGPGGLKRGAAADFITLDPEHPALVGRDGDTLIDSLVFAGRRGGIDTVWSQGRQVVASGCHHAREAITARYRQTLKALLA